MRLNKILIYILYVFLVTFSTLFSSVSSPQTNIVQFTQISSLSSSSIKDILQDSRGFIWIATDHGLFRWDGYNMKSFYHNPNEKNSLSSLAISSIFESSDSVLWISTYRNGLNKYNGELENFTQYDLGNINPKKEYQIIIWKMCEDNDKNLWLGTEYGLVKFNPINEQCKRFIIDSTFYKKNISDLQINNIRALCIKDDSTLLLGTAGGIVQFNVLQEKFVEFRPSQYTSNIFNIRDIYKENSKIFWMVSFSNGLYRYDIEQNIFKNYSSILLDAGLKKIDGLTSVCVIDSLKIWVGSASGLFEYNQIKNTINVFVPDSKNASSISSALINKIYFDKNKNLWIGTDNRGVNLLPRWQKEFQSYEWDSENSNSLGYGTVKSICEDNDGNIWIGSWGGGITEFNPSLENFTHYTTESSGRNRIQSDYINVIYNDGDDIWMGSTGLYYLNIERSSFNTIDELKYRRIRTICSNSDDELWIGFKYSGIALYRKSSKSIEYFFHNPNDSLSLSEDRVLCMYSDKSNTLWVGTINGLNKLTEFRSGNPKFNRYYYDSDDSHSISSNSITDIYEDSMGRIWVGTRQGLNLYDKKKDLFDLVGIIENSTNNTIQKIIEDDNGNLWIRWGEKLVKYNHDNGNKRIFDEGDGFLPKGQQGRWDNVLYKGESGMMYFGGVDKFVSFDPDKLKDNPDPPNIVITNFLINNNRVNISEDTPLKKSITELKEIELKYYQNIISFDFAALDYTNPVKNKYAYKMDGIDNGWIYTDATRRYASYTNLDPGKYVFSVKGSNSDGVWNEVGASITVIILSPWWATWWAYSIYAFVFVFFVYSIRRFELNRQKLKHGLELKRVETEKYREIDRIKSRFFANISHEFRTPLTLIKGPVQQMLSGEFKGNLKKQYQMILRHTNSLTQLINQLLDLSKLDSGKMTLRTSLENIVPLLKGLTQSFESLAKQNNIELNFHSFDEGIEVYIDRNKFEKIIINLLSNAFKFTPDGGLISVEINAITGNIQINNDFVEIKIVNSGEGISSEQLDKIFDRFYQDEDSSIRNYEGTGIGLALTKELVELHGGEIKVESVLKKNTTFTVCLPLGKKHLLREEVLETTLENTPDFDSELIETTLAPAAERETSEHQPVKEYSTLLIVEDNIDMRNYIRGSLESDYKIIEAENGEQGIQRSLKDSPDIIISDVMMPKMDGFQFCSEIKKDERTSHIPVILLTAKASGENKIEGLETGADDYLTKPFDTRELKVRINNLIEQRKRLQEKFRNEFTVSPRDITVTSIDEQLVEKAINVVENNISDTNFDTSIMAKEMGISRTLLHTKLKALTGLSTGEFIRTIRLKRAAQLLQQGRGNVTEVAYDVGFQNLSYFAKAFRKQFGQSPSHYSHKYLDRSK